MKTKFKIVLEKEAEGGYTVFVPALPGCHTQGDTIEKARENAREAIECYIESLRKDGLPVPAVSEELVCDVEVKV